MSVVSKSFSVVYQVKTRVTNSGSGGAFSTAFSSAFDSAVGGGGSGVVFVYNVKKSISNPVALKYQVRQIFSPAKVLSLDYGVRQRVSRNMALVYGVRVPIASSKTLAIRYNVRSRVLTNVVVQYDLLSSTSSTVSKSFNIRYHTLVTPGVKGLNAVPIEVDKVPPQIVTTSF